MILCLPYPPTGNHSVKHSRGRHYSTPETISYRAQVNAQVQAQNAARGLSGPLVVVCELFPPSNRRMDMDNRFKTLADALTHANVWKDDSQIVDLRLVRGEVRREGGMVTVEVTECV
jgi:crossover junction endodeoxyribonuclease RusA